MYRQYIEEYAYMNMCSTHTHHTHHIHIRYTTHTHSTHMMEEILLQVHTTKQREETESFSCVHLRKPNWAKCCTIELLFDRKIVTCVICPKINTSKTVHTHSTQHTTHTHNTHTHTHTRARAHTYFPSSVTRYPRGYPHENESKVSTHD